MKTEVQIKKMLDVMSTGIYEKEHIIAMSLLSAVAGESIFLLGPPGTAKSLVARRLKLAFSQSNAFEYLMSRFSTPDEIFGPVSISLLKNEDRYERVVDGFMPTATVVFLDEIWKASPSIQNTLLTAINERIFKNGRETITLPLKALIAASNELPAEDEGLEALWDRFLLRMVSNRIQTESTFYKMLRQKTVVDVIMPDDLKITDDLYLVWQQEIENIQIPDSILETITYIRKRLKAEGDKEGNNVMDYYVSDRRWKKCIHLLQTSAFLNGRGSINNTDIPILIHCLWNTTASIPIIIDIVTGSLTQKLHRQMDQIDKAIDQALKQVSQHEPKESRSVEEEFGGLSLFYYHIQNYPLGKCLFFKTDYAHIATYSDMDGILYRDKQKDALIVRAIYTGAPFDYQIKGDNNVKKVKLRKCNGGVIIDGIPYAFKRLNPIGSPSLFNNKNLPTSSITDTALTTLKSKVITDLQDIKESFEVENLFLSDDDKKMAKKYFTSCEKRTKEMEVKIMNAKELL